MPRCNLALTPFVVVMMLTLGASLSAQKKASTGTTFTVAKPQDQIYDQILNYLKREGETIDQANKEAGQIATGMIITGGYSQTGTRIQVTLIKETENQTTVRVAVTQQKRKKLLKTEPWSDPKVNSKASDQIAEKIKANF